VIGVALNDRRSNRRIGWLWFTGGWQYPVGIPGPDLGEVLTPAVNNLLLTVSSASEDTRTTLWS